MGNIKSGVLKLSNLIILTFAIFLCTCNGSSLKQLREDDNFFRDTLDSEANLTREEIKDGLRPSRTKPPHDNEDSVLSNEAPMPDFKPIVIAPSSPDIKSNKKISLSVTENIEIRDVLTELARLAELELALDPNIKGGIVLNVSNRPVGEVVEIVSDLADLRYSVKNGILKVVRDTPYLENYSVDFINLVRSGKGTINTQTQVLSVDVASSSGGGSGSNTGSTSGGNSSFNSGSQNQLTTEYSGDLWGSIEDNLIAILYSQTSKLKTRAENTDAPNRTNNQGAQDTPANTSANQTEQGQNTGSNSEDNNEVLTQSNSTQRKNNLTVSSKSAAATGDTSGGRLTTYYTINKQAGIISIMASYKKHKSIKEYLDKVKASMAAQVLIEAKVVEVELFDNYASGIQWNNLRVGNVKGSFDFTPNIGNIFKGVLDGATSKEIYKANYTKHDSATPTSILQFVQGFGITRVLQNPRVTAMNNQQVVLTFARNEVYFTVQGTLQQQTVSTTSATATQQPISVTSQLHTIPIGVILALQPSISLENQEVTMHIRPTLSQRIEYSNEDPAVALLKLSIPTTNGITAADLDQVTSKVPIVQVREMDTVLKAKSGDVMVIGGLIEHTDSSSETGVPLLSDIPLLGHLGKNHEKLSNVKETVILIQAKIITPDGYYHQQDKKVYETFTQDPRPLMFQ